MSAIQLNFTLRTSSKCKTVHLVGSWDGYKANVPLNRDSSKSGSWKGTYRFSTQAMNPGQRYWYYYIIDGYQVTHDPARPYIIEPTTSRKLNVLDIPPGAAMSSSGGYATQTMAPGRSRGHVTSGRSLSPSQIQHPYPSRPYETQVFRSDKFNSREMEALSRRYAAQRLADSSSEASYEDSDDSYEIPGLSSRSSGSSSPSSVSSLGSPISGGSPPMGYAQGQAYGLGIKACTCERYAVMKDGRRFRVDCQGKVCGGGMAGGYSTYSSSGPTESSDCSESSSEDERRKRSSKKKSSHHHHHSSSHRKGGLKIRR